MSGRWGGWLWAACLLSALALASAHKGFWGAHGEARRAEVSREVLQDGHWLVPTHQGEAFLTKPPLLYWSQAASMALFGVGEAAARVPSLLAALLTWLAMRSLARSQRRELPPESTSNAPTAEDSSSLLLGTPLFLALSLNAETEPLLLACSTWAVAAIHRLPARNARHRQLWPLLPAGLALALGFLVKGPLGWIFPLLGIAAFEIARPRGGRRLAVIDWILLFVIQLPIILPWFGLVLARHPEALSVWLGESVARLGDPEFQVHREPWWYYLPRLAVLLPGLLWLDPRAWRSRAARGPLLWLLLGVLFLSLASSKRAHYLLSLLPAAALLPLAAPGPDRWAAWRGRILDLAGWLLAALPLGATGWLVWKGWTGAGSLLLAGLPLAVRPGLRHQGGIPRWTGTTLAVLAAGSLTVLPAVDAYRNPGPFFQEAARIVGGTSPVATWRNDRSSAAFHFGHPVPAARNEVELDKLLPGQGWLLTQRKDLEPLGRPHQILLEHVLEDPFQPGRRREWVLVRVEGPVPTADSVGREPWKASISR